MSFQPENFTRHLNKTVLDLSLLLHCAHLNTKGSQPQCAIRIHLNTPSSDLFAYTRHLITYSQVFQINFSLMHGAKVPYLPFIAPPKCSNQWLGNHRHFGRTFLETLPEIDKVIKGSLYFARWFLGNSMERVYMHLIIARETEQASPLITLKF
jgi:hypothetical protein